MSSSTLRQRHPSDLKEPAANPNRALSADDSFTLLESSPSQRQGQRRFGMAAIFLASQFAQRIILPAQSPPPVPGAVKSKHSIWLAIKKGDLDEVKADIEKDVDCLRLRGDLGEIPLHLCFLYYKQPQRDIAFYLIRTYPYLAKVPYTGSKYYGETVLHMAIVHKDMEMVNFLLEVCPKLIKHKATGDFFRPGGPCYYGEYPVSFAACTDQRAMVEVLHNAVETLWDSVANPPPRQLNNDRLSPLTYAASIGNGDMFQHLLQKNTVIMAWHFGPTSLCLHPLAELDYIPYDEDRKTVVQLLIEREHMELLDLPRVKAILHEKWSRFAQRLFFQRLIIAVVYLCAFTSTIVFRGCAETQRQRVAFWLIRLAVLLVSQCKLSIEFKEMLNSGPAEYFGTRGAMFLENITSLVHCTVISMLYLIKLVDLLSDWDIIEEVEPMFLAIASIFGWSYMLFFFLGIRHTGPFVLMIYNMLMGDVLRFIAIHSVFLMGFSTAFYVLWGKTKPMPYAHQLEANFLMMVGDFDSFYSQSSLSENPAITVCFMIFYIILVTILLVNLLIAMMGCTYSTIIDAAERRWLLEWARIICSLEQEMSAEDKEEYKYWEEVEGLRYIRVYDEKTRYAERWASSSVQFKPLGCPENVIR